MSHRRFFRGRSVSQSQRRKKVWGAFRALAGDAVDTGTEGTLLMNFAGTSTAIIGNRSDAVTSFVFEAQNFGNEIVPESTLIRLRGALELTKNSIDVTDQFTRAFGIGVIETGAALLGSTPNPASPEGANWDGWMFWRSIQQGALDANAGIVDVKAMRKIQSGYSLVFAMGEHVVTDNGTPPSVGAFTSGFFTARGLFLLP